MEKKSAFNSFIFPFMKKSKLKISFANAVIIPNKKIQKSNFSVKIGMNFKVTHEIGIVPEVTPELYPVVNARILP